MALVLSNELRQLDLGNSYQDGQNASWNLSDILDALTMDYNLSQPYLEIIEQPAPKNHRFRYKRESRSLGTLPGVNSTAEKKTYPTIKIHNHTGKAAILVSCVTKEEPYRPHPHKLMSRTGDEKGYLYITCEVTPEYNEFQIKTGVQCMKINEVASSLRERQKLEIDPFRTGFSHIDGGRAIELGAVRLCFQVFLPDDTGRCRRPLRPVVSDIVYDRKAFSGLHITTLLPTSGTVRGGTEVILLCEKVTTNDVVVFYLEENDKVVWEETAQTSLIHKQVAIVVTAPAFRHPDTKKNVIVQIQLKKLSDNSRSNSVSFEYIPDLTDVTVKQKMVSSLLQSHHDKIATAQLLAPVYQGDWRVKPAEEHVSGLSRSHSPFAGEVTRIQSYVPSPSVSLPGPSPLSGQPSPMTMCSPSYGGQDSPILLNYGGGITQYAVPQSNLELNSPALMQQNVQQSLDATGAMETDANSSASLSNLQFNSEEMPMLSSGELNQYKEI